MSASDVGVGDGDGSTISLGRKPPTLETDTLPAQLAASQEEECKDGGEVEDVSGGGGGDGSAVPLKRKLPTPETDTAHTQQRTSQDEACEDGGCAADVSDGHDKQGPAAKRPRLDTDPETDGSNTQLEPLPEKQAETGTRTQSKDGNEEALTASVPELDMGTEIDASIIQRESLSEKQEPTASTQPNNLDLDLNDEEDPTTTTTTTPPKPEPKKCGICDKEPGKYKCPRCPLAYCSVACNKIHKENHPPPPPPSSKPDEQPPSNSTAAQTRSSNQRQSNNDPYEVLLRHRAEFDRLMERYPGLEKILFNIQKSTLPPPDDPTANGGVPTSILQQTGGVSGFVPPGKSYGAGRPPQREMWTGEVGLRRGVAALKKARTNPGVLGDGVREFCELVMYLLNNPSLQGSDGFPSTTTGPDATSLVRQEVMADQTKVIQTLLEVEKDGDDL